LKSADRHLRPQKLTQFSDSSDIFLLKTKQQIISNLNLFLLEFFFFQIFNLKRAYYLTNLN